MSQTSSSNWSAVRFHSRRDIGANPVGWMYACDAPALPAEQDAILRNLSRPHASRRIDFAPPRRQVRFDKRSEPGGAAARSQCGGLREVLINFAESHPAKFIKTSRKPPH